MTPWPEADHATWAAVADDPAFRAQVLAAGAAVWTHPLSQQCYAHLAALVREGRVVDRAALSLAVGRPITAPASTAYWPQILDQHLAHHVQAVARWMQRPHAGGPRAVATRAVTLLQDALHQSQALGVWSGAEAAEAGLARLAAGDPAWVKTGIPALDTATAAWGPGDLVLIGARPSHGKTALGVQIARHTAAHGRGVAFCSVEMAPAAIGMRLVAQGLDTPLAAVVSRLGDPATASALADLAQWPLAVIDANGSRVADLEGAVATQELGGVRYPVVVVDYLHLVTPERALPHREQEVSQIAQALKRWARRDGRLVVALAQLSRRVDDRADRRPTLADLRESGTLEQVADGVILIHHGHAATAELIVAKNRNGPTGPVPAVWDGPVMQFQPAPPTGGPAWDAPARAEKGEAT